MLELLGLRDMNVQNFAYVDLNTMMYLNAKKLAEWEREFGDEHIAKAFDEFAKALLDTIENVCCWIFIQFDRALLDVYLI